MATFKHLVSIVGFIFALIGQAIIVSEIQNDGNHIESELCIKPNVNKHTKAKQGNLHIWCQLLATPPPPSPQC